MGLYKITSKSANKCLNIYGDNVTSLSSHQNVCLWADSGSNEQTWDIPYLSTGTYIRSAINTGYGLNVNRSGSPWNCDVYPINGNETDAKINIVYVSNGYYKIQLTNYTGYCLTAGGTGNGSNVYWATATNGDNQLWAIDSPSSSGLGAPVTYNQLSTLSDVDLISRCIYSEARGETDAGKRGVACVIRNRKNRNSAEFGGNTYSGVILKPGQFSGMSTSAALSPNTNDSSWIACVAIAQNIASINNPIGSCLWFYTNTLFNQSVTSDGYINLGGGLRKVTTKYVIGNHTFFLVSGY